MAIFYHLRGVYNGQTPDTNKSPKIAANSVLQVRGSELVDNHAGARVIGGARTILPTASFFAGEAVVVTIPPGRQQTPKTKTS